MSKNRRKNKLRVQSRKPGVHGVIPGTLFGALVFLATFALGYLYVCGRCDALGKKIQDLEKTRDNLRREIVNEEYKWSRLMAPESMERLLREHRLEMIWPSEDSVVRLRRDPLPHIYVERIGAGGIAHD